MYYVAQPPFTGLMLTGNLEGNYIWVNKNLIEIVTLLMIFRLPGKWFFSLDNLVADWKTGGEKSKKIGAIEVPELP